MSEPDRQAGPGGAPVRRRPSRSSEAALQAHLGERARRRRCWPSCRPDYAGRGVRLERQGRAWAFRTAPELAPLLQREPGPAAPAVARRAGDAGGRSPTSSRSPGPRSRRCAAWRWGKGTLDLLVEAGWVAPKGRRETPGRPVTWVTTAGLPRPVRARLARRSAAARRAGGRFTFQSAARRLEARAMPPTEQMPSLADRRRRRASRSRSLSHRFGDRLVVDRVALAIAPGRGPLPGRARPAAARPPRCA